MIIHPEQLPVYAYPLLNAKDKDFIDLKKRLEDIQKARLSFSQTDIAEINKFAITNEENEKDEFKNKIFSIYTKADELSYVFIYCHSELKTITNSVKQETADKLQKYTELFKDLDIIKDLLETIRLQRYNKTYYETMLQRVISPYNQSMLDLIRFTQQTTNAFSNQEPDPFAFLTKEKDW